MPVSDDPGMKSFVVSIATVCARLVGDGLERSVVADAPSSGIVPTVDLPAPEFFGQDAGRGGQAARVEFDDVELDDEMSTWYRLAYVQGGTRLTSLRALCSQHRRGRLRHAAQRNRRLARRQPGRRGQHRLHGIDLACHEAHMCAPATTSGRLPG